ncbi:hypothetical protein [Desulfonema ishimotonii]|nr:hypothetical protein [Desulfonema ishimotonii]
MTALENGELGDAAVYAAAMVGEQVLTKLYARLKKSLYNQDIMHVFLVDKCASF